MTFCVSEFLIEGAVMPPP